MKNKTLNKKGLLVIILALVLLVLFSLISATAAANTVPATKARSQVVQSVLTANELKPPECSGLNLEEIVVGSGSFTGTKKNELILGSPGDDTIKGNGGDDCILGGGGDDNLQGGKGGNDVCIGGPGNDHFKDCKVEIE